jgi:hypothetical protein
MKACAADGATPARKKISTHANPRPATFVGFRFDGTTYCLIEVVAIQAVVTGAAVIPADRRQRMWGGDGDLGE